MSAAGVAWSQLQYKQTRLLRCREEVLRVIDGECDCPFSLPLNLAVFHARRLAEKTVKLVFDGEDVRSDDLAHYNGL